MHEIDVIITLIGAQHAELTQPCGPHRCSLVCITRSGSKPAVVSPAIATTAAAADAGDGGIHAAASESSSKCIRKRHERLCRQKAKPRQLSMRCRDIEVVRIICICNAMRRPVLLDTGTRLGGQRVSLSGSQELHNALELQVRLVGGIRKAHGHEQLRGSTTPWGAEACFRGARVHHSVGRGFLCGKALYSSDAYVALEPAGVRVRSRSFCSRAAR